MMRCLLALACALLPAAGLAQNWTYRYADQQFGRHRFDFTISADLAAGNPVSESLAVAGGPPITQVIDKQSGAYLGRTLGGARSLLEYLPYALAEGEPAAWPQPAGYPTYATPYLEWRYTVKAEGWETVTVPGGTFKALRVAVAGERGKDPDPMWWPKQAMRFRQTFWYSPEVKRYVKMQHTAWSMDGAPFASELVELLGHRPGG